ncbi:uncharacterized protein BP01DRAFT_361098 [Aspergillus saccharolyticus JOP 1030-1]|uniref:BZIP domain-containing protein n=1 Tax=Aspergillus saccharolyticus JOP 1030-1 TaxID=1450539 RepID=A0A318Z2J0_9EURO|nr:hypothetical protein BP01DRAFT_361098 [Aspergillus saccharolyticus JOP 1030-1]PYH40594.1 hypothetical protein BP01DRAFT_361098 [Aspergillus saccharolyticus JOP 1030-1]
MAKNSSHSSRKAKQSLHLQISREEDWRQYSDPAIRRKLQNRIAQRKHRLKIKLLKLKFKSLKEKTISQTDPMHMDSKQVNSSSMKRHDKRIYNSRGTPWPQNTRTTLSKDTLALANAELQVLSKEPSSYNNILVTALSTLITEDC